MEGTRAVPVSAVERWKKETSLGCRARPYLKRKTSEQAANCYIKTVVGTTEDLAQWWGFFCPVCMRPLI